MSELTRAEVAQQRLERLMADFAAETAVDDVPPDEFGTGDPSSTDSARTDDSGPARSAGHRAAPRRALSGVHLRVLAVALVAAVVLVAWWTFSGRPEATDVPVPEVTSDVEPSITEPDGSGEADELIVDVAGDVREPGIVVLKPGSRVHEAIEAAGGLDGTVDTTALNLARELSDGEQVLVGVEPAAGAEGASGTATPDAGGPGVNLNAASAEELQTLPGVGPVTAEAIISWRDANGSFGAIEDVLEVKGIGDATFAELRDLITV